MIKAYCITIDNNEVSLLGYQELLNSSIKLGNSFQIEKFSAITPKTIQLVMDREGIAWNYPWEVPVLDPQTGLRKTPYRTNVPLAKIACALSHYLLWKHCEELQEPILILEHDALFIQHLDPKQILKTPKFDIIGINSPFKATRKVHLFAKLVEADPRELQEVPRVDEPEIPQGLAGASAYLMKPSGATKAISLVKSLGLWPNDALLCYQLLGDSLGVTREWYTMINTRIPSSTV